VTRTGFHGSSRNDTRNGTMRNITKNETKNETRNDDGNYNAHDNIRAYGAMKARECFQGTMRNDTRNDTMNETRNISKVDDVRIEQALMATIHLTNEEDDLVNITATPHLTPRQIAAIGGYYSDAEDDNTNEEEVQDNFINANLPITESPNELNWLL
jgi:hypothetical protein